MVNLAPGTRNVRVHGDGCAVPALIVGHHQDNVGTISSGDRSQQQAEQTWQRQADETHESNPVKK